MEEWKAISEADFLLLFQTQYDELSEEERLVFERFRVPFWRAKIRRSKEFGDEQVYVVAETDGAVLYFDDVECGFDVSSVSEEGRILQPGGSQATLSEAVQDWFPLGNSTH